MGDHLDLFWELSQTPLPGYTIRSVINPAIHIVADDGVDYTVTVDYADVDEDDGECGRTLDESYPCGKGVIKDHFDVLETILRHLGRRIPGQITNLTTDGDHKDCEAIFLYEGDWWVVRVR